MDLYENTYLVEMFRYRIWNIDDEPDEQPYYFEIVEFGTRVSRELTESNHNQ